MKTKLGYSDRHAAAGISAKLPDIECWPNQFPAYDITITVPEYTSICPKTQLPDFGTIVITYRPKKNCVELKSLKMYLLAYRELGIFYENAVNRILNDVVNACSPQWCIVRGDFSSRGGIHSSIEARFGKPNASDRK
jgi:7-cyano-7-deazaguanine reductase